MAETETLVVDKPVVETMVNPFSENGWKNQPTIPIAATDPVIDEKDKQIKEDKPTVVKPDEPEKIPGASPHPIQDRPDEVKENVKPKEEPKPTATGLVPEPIKFANEESEKIFNLIKEGKTEEVYSILAEQKKLGSAEGADAIKLQLQYQNKDFSTEDINDLFNERYATPEKPVQLDTEDDEEFNVKMEKYEKEVKRVESRINRDAKPAKTELLKLQKEIVLPDIPKPEAQVNEPTQEELDAQKQRAEKFSQSVDDGLQKWEGYSATFKDEEVEIKVAYTPTAEEKKELQPIISLAGTNAGEFMQKIGWVDDKGNINTAKLAEDLPLILSKEKVLNKLVSETGNKRHEASIKSIKNIDYSGGQSNGNLGATNQEKEGAMVNHFFSQ